MRSTLGNRLAITVALVLVALVPRSTPAQVAAVASTARPMWEYGVASTIYSGTTISWLRWFEGDSAVELEGNQFAEMARRIAGRPVPGGGVHSWYNALGEKGWELVLCRESPTGAPGGRDVSCTFKREKR